MKKDNEGENDGEEEKKGKEDEMMRIRKEMKRS